MALIASTTESAGQSQGYAVQAMYAEVSAYQTSGDSTRLFRLQGESWILHSLTVVVDSGWHKTDSLKIGIAGSNAGKPGNLYESDSAGRNAIGGRIVFVYDGPLAVNSDIWLYHPDIGVTDYRGRVRVYARLTNLAGDSTYSYSTPADPSAVFLTAVTGTVEIEGGEGVYTKVTGLTVSVEHGIHLAATDSSIVVLRSGYYHAGLHSSFSAGTANRTLHISVWVNEADSETIEAERKIGTAGDVGSMGATGILYLNQGDILSARMEDGNGANTVTLNHLQFYATPLK